MPALLPRSTAKMTSELKYGNISLAGQSGGLGNLVISKEGFGWKSRDSNRQVSVASSEFSSLQWLRGARAQQIRLRMRGGATVRFEGFREQDHTTVDEFVTSAFGKPLTRGSQAVRGWSWGQVEFVEGGAPSLVFNAGGGTSAKHKASELEEAFEISIGTVANVQLPNKNELAVDVHVDDTAGKMDEELVEMRWYIPDEANAADLLGKIKERADTSAFAGETICSFNEVALVVPRGRYEVDMFPNHIKLHGKSTDFKILYSSITRLFLLPKPDDVLVSFVMSLDPPIRQGSTMYPHIVFNFNSDVKVDVDLAIEEEDLKTRYKGKLQKTESGEIWRVFSKVMKSLSKSPLHVPKNFKNSNDSYAVRTALGAAEGFLFFLESCCFFVNKPPTYIRYDDIDSAEFKRMELERRFDLAFSLISGSNLLFSNIDRTEFQLIFKFLESKEVPIENADVLRRSGGRPGQAAMMIDEDDDDSESDDSDFDVKKAKAADKKAQEAGGQGRKGGKHNAVGADDADDDDDDDDDFADESASDSDDMGDEDVVKDESEVMDLVGDMGDQPKTKRRKK